MTKVLQSSSNFLFSHEQSQLFVHSFVLQLCSITSGYKGEKHQRML